MIIWTDNSLDSKPSINSIVDYGCVCQVMEFKIIIHN